MPFTFSHPIFAAPLKAVAPKYVSLTGLILGSMSPDFEYFLFLEPYRSIGHTTAGLFLQAIPLSVLFAVLFHTLIKQPLAVHLPSWFGMDRRAFGLIQPWKLHTFHGWAVFLSSVIVGFYSHLFVDEFTHRTGYYVELWPVLQQTLAGFPLYKWLQYSLGVFGLLIESIMLLWLLARAPDVRRFDRPGIAGKAVFWMIVVCTMLLTVSFKLWMTPGGNITGIVVVSPISGFFIGLLLSSIVYKMKKKV